jgi:hypothetical protein
MTESLDLQEPPRADPTEIPPPEPTHGVAADDSQPASVSQLPTALSSRYRIV